MPKREDEPKGRGLCPFCGSSNIYEHYGSWRCRKCGKLFPSPSYGPGEDFGKEARLLGKSAYVSPQEDSAIDEFEEHRVRLAEREERQSWCGKLKSWIIGR